MNRIPYRADDFKWTKWSATEIKSLIPKILAQKKSSFATIKKIPIEKRNFENTIYAIEASDYGISELILKIDLLQNVALEKVVRDAAKRAINTIQHKMVAISHDKKIWQAIKDYKNGAWKSEQKFLDNESKKLFHDMFLSYKQLGLDMPPQKQKRIKELSQKIAKVSNEFRQNINAYKDHILVTDDELLGLSERYKEGLTRTPDGKYKVTLSYPDYHPFIELAKSEVKRKEIAEKFLQRGGIKNMKVLAEMLKLRIEHAHLLGYKTHADYKTELRMAKSGENAKLFLDSLLKKVAEAGMRDIDELRDIKREITGDKKAKLHFYDIAYYGHELQKKRFELDSEKVREYFPLSRVLDGTLKIYSTLFGVTFKKISGIPLWSEDVSIYEIRTERGELLSYFALDLHPRDGKYGHAAAFGVIGGRHTSFKGEGYVTPFATMVTNFTKPTAKNPSILSHSEVETFLHEFGHIMHFALTTAKYESQSGYNTARDFIEAPSQMLEHWAWNKKSIALLSSHYKTGKSLPVSILKNLLASKEHMLRYGVLRQIICGILDLTIHTKNNPPEPAKLYRDLIKKYTGITLPRNAIFPAGFSHLDGYDAGYYGYLWSNVYAADMFTRFEKEGILNKKTGEDYKKLILEKGGSTDELSLVEAFLGRKTSNKAFLKEIGVK